MDVIRRRQSRRKGAREVLLRFFRGTLVSSGFHLFLNQWMVYTRQVEIFALLNHILAAGSSYRGKFESK